MVSRGSETGKPYPPREPTPAIFNCTLHFSAQALFTGGPIFPAPDEDFVRRMGPTPPPLDEPLVPKPSSINRLRPRSILRSLRSRRSSNASAGSSTVNSEMCSCESTRWYVAVYKAAGNGLDCWGRFVWLDEWDLHPWPCRWYGGNITNWLCERGHQWSSFRPCVPDCT